MNATTTKGSGRWPTANCQDVTLLFLHRTLPRMIWRFPRPREISKKCWYVACFLASLSRSFDWNYQFRCITSDNHGTALFYAHYTINCVLDFYFTLSLIRSHFLKIQIQAMDLDCDTIFVIVYNYNFPISLYLPGTACSRVVSWTKPEKRKKSFDKFLQGDV